MVCKKLVGPTPLLFSVNDFIYLQIILKRCSFLYVLKCDKLHLRNVGKLYEHSFEAVLENAH